jgi:hypothetical protein
MKKKEKIDFREEEQCVCEEGPCSCSVLQEEIGSEKLIAKE